MKVDDLLGNSYDPGLSGLCRGVFPYFGGGASVPDVRRAVELCGGAMTAGKGGAAIARKVDGVWVDPAVYTTFASGAPGALSDPGERADPDGLFDLDEWLEWQRAAKAGVLLTDSARIRRDDRAGLRAALRRWEEVPEPTLVVLPVEPWWLVDGLELLIEQVKAAGRPVAIVLPAPFNGLDRGRAVAGLVTFIAAVEPLPVVLPRFDVSAIGGVAHGAFAGFVGVSTTTRHSPVPLPRRDRDSHSGDPDERDMSPSVFVPAFCEYVKVTTLPALRRWDTEALRCHDVVCGGRSLLRLARLWETDQRAARAEAARHQMAATEQLARNVLLASDPAGAWWEHCKGGADMMASLTGRGVSLPLKPWLRQWIELGSASREGRVVR